MQRSGEQAFKLRLGLLQRLSTRMVLLQATVLTVVLVLASFALRSREMLAARESLQEVSHTLLPFMVPSIRPALDLAVDEMTGKVDPDLLQIHIVDAAFKAAQRNQDIVYSELLLPGGKSALRSLSETCTAEDIDALFGDAPMVGDYEIVSGRFVATQVPIRTPDGRTYLGTLRVAFSLDRARALLRETMTMGAVGAALLLALALGVSAILVHLFLYRPMATLLTGVRAMASGKLNARIDTTQQSEIGLLGRAFQAVARALGDAVIGIKETSGAISGTVQTMGDSSQRMLSGARSQSDAVLRVINSVNSVDGSSRAIDESVVELTQAAQSVARATEALSGSLNRLTPQVQQFSGFVGSTDEAMRDMTILASEIASRVNEMAASTNVAAATVGELERAIATISTNAGEATVLAESVTQQAQECRSAVQENILGMSNIADTFDSINGAVMGLGDSVDAISQIVQVIGEITGQAKLLSLNASILASQAGEHGKGFSVVAEEMKALSERTANSTREIAVLIDSLELERKKTSTAMAAGIRTVRAGEQLSRRAGDAIASILTLTDKSHLQMSQIATATGEQVTGSREIAQTTQRIAEMCRQVLQNTGRQKSAADAVSGNTAKIVQGLDGVLATLRREAEDSTRVAQAITKILQRAEAVQGESTSQRHLSARIVSDVSSIKGVAETVLSDAERVAHDIESLVGRVDRLRSSIESFEVG